MPRDVVGVVEEEHQVAQADQGVGAVAGAGQGVGPTVDVADDVQPHRPVLTNPA